MRRSLIVTALVMPVATSLAILTPASGAVTAAAFYVNTESQANQWVRNNGGDPRAAGIQQKIADVPRSTWFASYDANSSNVTASVKKVTDGAAAEGTTASVVAYMIPNRDCGSHSAGGAPDYASYTSWIQAFSQGLGDREVFVLLEPDAIAQSANCQSVDKEQRLTALKQAGATITATNPNAKVYYDGGHSGWKVSSADLRAAGVEQGDGVVTNVSNFRTTADEVAYGKQLLSEIGDSSLGLVVDTSRNGNGPTPDSQWCNPSGRALGSQPTTSTGDGAVHAFLWVKQPGESDGYCNGGPGAGTFSPELADELVRNTAG
ncbi:glycoside hydrolase family 6 protein [Streptomyces sp. NPDC048639]|uniref:glycoside hydrolase family 6 protein n=1 Tax=Streptomyces sp. NPDC048639 TaxID=3365581 RepID=UPI0037227324